MSRSACFNVPKYHRTLWNEYSATAKDETAAMGSYGDERAAGFSQGFVPELYHRLFAEIPNELPATDRAAAVRAKLHALASELPEFDTLRKQTVRNPTWAGMGACALASSIARALPERYESPDADKARQILDGLKSLASESPEAADALGEHVARAEGTVMGKEVATLEQAAGLDESDLRNAIRVAIEAAQQSIDAAEQAMHALGCGKSFDNSSPSMGTGVAVELARRVASSPTLKRIVELAGRLTMTARAKRATRSEYARSEIVGVEQTGNIARILPCEMMGLSSPLGTAALYRKLIERSALGYKMAGKEREAKGPIVVVLDQSWSMNADDKDAWAKAVALALLDAAKSDGRAFGVVLYNGGVIDARLFPNAKDVDPRQLLDLLSLTPAGGTSFEPAIRQALDWIETAHAFGKADVVHITDGESSLEGSLWAKARATRIGAHLYGIAIGASASSYVLGMWSDEVVAISDVSSDTAAVNLIFDNL